MQPTIDSGTASVVPAPAPDLEAYLHRRGDRVNAKRWFPRFDLERPIFAEDQELSASRPKAAKPAAWHHMVDLDAAFALAKKEGKPLLVDFEADWCVWCKRVDYYTYGDADSRALNCDSFPNSIVDSYAHGNANSLFDAIANGVPDTICDTGDNADCLGWWH